MRYKFSMPYNGDTKIIDIVLSDYADYVESFYGSFGIDSFGGGRAQKSNFIDSEEKLREITRKLCSQNIKFNYVINNTDLLNREFEPSFIVIYKAFVKKLIGLGINIITLCNPYLIRLTKDEFPRLEISASVNLKVRSLEEAQYIVDLGCDEIVLHYDILKNFPVLKTIRENCPVPLKLIPNDVYIMNCPWQKGHTRMQGAHSRDKTFETPYFSYYRNKCINIRNFRPDEIFKAMWFPPSHIEKYVSIGYSHFKLLDRLATTEWNIRALQSYIEGKVTPHLEEILGTYGKKGNPQNSTKALADTDPVYPRDKLEAIPHIYDSESSRSNKIFKYWTSDSHPTQCGPCRGCSNMAEQNMFFPPSYRDAFIRNNREWQNRITKLEFIEQLNNSYIQRIEYKCEEDKQ